MIARTLMVQGTASSVGKSLLVTALCRAFSRAGLRVAPFKSQNMALNAAVAEGGGEIGRAQAVQAEAAGLPPTVDMNPILLKPEGERASQVVVLGRSIGSMRAGEYHARKPELRGVVAEALARLRARVDLVVIEGAGSPAEVNLKEQDLVNMHVARIADAPVLLVGDIDRGGVFASLVGTLELLEPEERARVAGLVINKFRGERALLDPGLEFLVRRTGIPVLGVLPYLRDLRISDEDSVSLDARRDRAAAPGELDLAVVRLPRISNHDDLQPFDHEPGVALRFATRPEELAGADLVILPGSKGTVADLRWLRQNGMAAAIAARADRGEPVLGICGGCQMLGVELLDPDHAESQEDRVEGLGLLPFRTRFGSDKTTAQVRGRLAATSLLGDEGAALAGYEIHQGQLEPLDGAVAAVALTSRNGAPCQVLDGAVDPRRPIAGTLVHGLFEDPRLRAALLGRLRARRGLAAPAPSATPTRDEAYDRLARSVLDHLDWSLLCRIAGLAPRPAPAFPGSTLAGTP
jgi:adenosylcobyric acid synthase